MDPISYKTLSANKNAINKKWLLIDASNCILGRLATEVARLIRGKHKPGFTPHVDCGDNIVIINAKKVKLTGKKLTDKVYLSHTGYPGGQREVTPKELLEKHPIRIIEHAVKGMLPKNRLGRKLYGNLFVYEGTSHPHQGQKPERFEMKV